jgi:hypothetical protein
VVATHRPPYIDVGTIWGGSHVDDARVFQGQCHLPQPQLSRAGDWYCQRPGVDQEPAEGAFDVAMAAPFLGEPCEVQRKAAPDGLTRNTEGVIPSAFRVFAYISMDFAIGAVFLKISGSREVIRGPVGTLWVATEPRTSRGKTLTLTPVIPQTG